MLRFLYQLTYISIRRELNTSATVSILSRLYYPYLIRFTLIFLRKRSILRSVKGSDVISLWNIVKRVFVFYFRKEMKKGLEEIFFRADTVVSGNMISKYIWVECFFKRYYKSLFGDKLFYLPCLLKGQNFSV